VNARTLWSLSDWIGIFTYIGLIAALFWFWLHPSGTAAERINTIEIMFIFEFLMVHSGTMMAVMPRRLSLFVLIPFYGLFAWALSTAAPSSGFLWVYFGIVFLRMRFAFANTSRGEKVINIAVSISGVVIYFAAIIITALSASKLPRLGLTDEFLEEAGYQPEITEAVLNTAHHFVALMIIYFTLIMIAEIIATIARNRLKPTKTYKTDPWDFQI